MAQVAELFAHLEEEEEEEETDDVEDDDDDDDDDDDESLDLAPLCSPTFVANPFGSVFSTGRRISSSSSVDTILSEFFDEHPIFPHDRLDRVPPPPPLDPETLDSRDFRVLDVDDDYLSLDEGEDEEVGNEIFVTGRIDCHESSGCGLQIVDLGSDSDSLEDERVMSIADSHCARDRGPVDLTLPLCWDFLRIEEERRDPSEDFEWEEVDDRLDDRGVLSMMVGIDDDETSSGSQLELEEARQLEEEEEGFVESDRNVDWEVLLEISDSGITRSSPSAFMDHVEAISDFGDDSEDFVNPLYEEFPIGQVADHDSMTRACPPAAKMVVENLPSIMLTLEDLADNATLCAVCKDAFSVGEKAKRLPCSHWYHQDCILPWFGIRNTCPVCRYELPTDDPEYERSKARRQAGGAVNNEESLLRADFEVLSEDSYRRRVFFNYEKRIRLQSPPEKVFEYFASFRNPNGEVFMTPADLMRAVVPVFPPSESDIVREGHLRGEHHPGELHCATSEFFMFFDTNSDGLISFPEYIFFVTLLSIPESSFSVAFKMFDLDHNGEIEIDEFKKVMALMRSHNRQGASQKGGLRVGLKVGKSVENGGILEYFFGKDGTGCLKHDDFVQFLRDLHDEIIRLEFAHYDYKSRGTISAKDFGLSMVASADINHISKFLDRVDELNNLPHLKEIRVSLEEFNAFAQLRRSLRPLSLAIFSYGRVNGLLTKQDFQRAAYHVCGIALSENLVDLIFHVFDANRDGNLSSEEFLRALQRRESDIRQTTVTGVTGLLACWLNCTSRCSFTRMTV